ncbi:MAG: hypothetical protein Q8P02_03885, partial [Candidatus Micrarchaeota archaeon]|nr:hypothetical protein [Candidatus Micrarchaeota archaeon]
RTKEQEEDYGYITEPDLPPLALSEEFLESAKTAMKELPEKAVARLKGTVPDQYAEVLVYQNLLPYFESSKTRDNATVAKWVCGDLLKCMNFHGISSPQIALPVTELDALLSAISTGKITERAAKEYIKDMVTHKSGLADVLAKENGGDMKALVQKILSENEKAVSEYRAGKQKSLEFLLGEFLKQNRGFHPNDVRKALEAAMKTL